ncbi:MAG: flagellar export chaperone FliS [Pseudomonadota bacterium]
MIAPQRTERAMRAYGQAAATQPGIVLVQLHDGMVAKLEESRTAAVEGRIEDRLAQSMKVAAVIEGLHLALDNEAGGEIAAGLDRLYRYFLQRITQLNLTNDASICDELIERLRELRGGWAAANATANGTHVTGAASA